MPQSSTKLSISHVSCCAGKEEKKREGNDVACVIEGRARKDGSLTEV